MDKWWFFCNEPEILKFIKNDKTFLEKDPLEQICKINKLGHYNTMIFGNAWTLLEIKKYSKLI